MYFWIATEVVYLQCWHCLCHMKLQPSRCKFCVHCTTKHRVTSCKATCYHPRFHRLNKLATVMNDKPAVACYKHSVHQLPFKASVDVLFWTFPSWAITWPSLRRSEMLSSLRHYMQAQSLGCHTTDDDDCGLWRGGVEKGNAQWSAFKIWGMDVVIIMNIRPTMELFQRKHWWNLWQSGWSA